MTSVHRDDQVGILCAQSFRFVRLHSSIRHVFCLGRLPATRLLLNAERIDAHEALRLNLVSYVYAKASFANEARALLKRLHTLAPEVRFDARARRRPTRRKQPLLVAASMPRAAYKRVGAARAASCARRGAPAARSTSSIGRVLRAT